jgi:FkbM family methyltransferase
MAVAGEHRPKRGVHRTGDPLLLDVVRQRMERRSIGRVPSAPDRLGDPKAPCQTPRPTRRLDAEAQVSDARPTNVPRALRAGRAAVRTAVKRVLARLGLEVQRTKPAWAALDTLPTLATIVDVGVAYGTPDLYDRFPTSRLLLVEPVPQFHAQLEQTVLRTRDAELYRCAAGAEPGRLDITVPAVNPKKASAATRTELTRDTGAHEVVHVDVRPLDAILATAELRRPALLKIDTEGFELDVLRGAEQVLQQIDYVMLEVSVESRFEDSYRFEDVIDHMRAHGFEVAHVVSAPTDRNGIIRYLDLLFSRAASA